MLGSKEKQILEYLATKPWPTEQQIRQGTNTDTSLFKPLRNLHKKGLVRKVHNANVRYALVEGT